MPWTSQALRWLRQLLNRERHRDEENKSGKVEAIAENAPRTYNELTSELRCLVESGEQEKSEQLLQELHQQFPVPMADILRKEMWGLKTDQLILRTHARMDMTEAIYNVESTGRKLTNEEKEQLRTIAFHWCSWSPTAAEHRNNSWMRFLRFAYPSLNGLQPILDSLIWPDEIAHYPIGHVPLPPWLFLLATPTKFYVYNFQDIAMREAGDTLAEVLNGMRKEGWCEEEIWKEVPSTTEEDPSDYFPVYDGVQHTTQEHELEHKVKEFTLTSR